MGSKLEAKALMAAAGVPVLPGVHGATPSADRRRRGRAASASRCSSRRRSAAAAAACGSCATPADLERRGGRARAARPPPRSATTPCSSSATSSDPRHVEVQIFGDAHGSVVVACSSASARSSAATRRSSRSAPSPAVDDALRERSWATAAVAAGKALGYVGAGTVEFVARRRAARSSSSRSTRACRSSTRSPSWSPGLDLVRAAARDRRGRAAAAATCSRRRSTATRSRRASTPRTSAARLPARDGHAPPLPRARPAGCASTRAWPTARWWAPHYDPMLAKVIAHGATRAEAARRLRRRCGAHRSTAS